MVDFGSEVYGVWRGSSAVGSFGTSPTGVATPPILVWHPTVLPLTYRKASSEQCHWWGRETVRNNSLLLLQLLGHGNQKLLFPTYEDKSSPSFSPPSHRHPSPPIPRRPLPIYPTIPYIDPIVVYHLRRLCPYSYLSIPSRPAALISSSPAYNINHQIPSDTAPLAYVVDIQNIGH